MGENRLMADLYEENQRLKARIEELEAKHFSECGQIAHYDDELKEARKLLTPTRYKTIHEEWDMHGEHYKGDYVLCPNCDKVLTSICDGKVTPVVSFCPDCGQKIDWSMGGSENG